MVEALSAKEYENYQTWSNNEVKPTFSFKGHSNSVETVAFGPNRVELVSGSHDHSIRRWDLNTMKCSDVFIHHKEGVWSLQYSNDGNTLLSCSPDKTILLFDIRSKKPITFLKGHTNKVYYAKFNENNSLIASGGEDSQIIIWDMRTQTALKQIEVNSMVVYSVQFSGNGKYLLSSDFDGVIQIYETGKFDVIAKTEKIAENRAYSIAVDWSEDSKYKNVIFSGYMDSKCRRYIFDSKNKKIELTTEFQEHLDSVKNIVLNSKLDLLVSSSRDGSIRVVNGNSLEFIASLIGHSDNTSCVDICRSSKGTLIASGSWDQTVNLYKL